MTFAVGHPPFKRITHGHEPTNVRWATRQQQVENRRVTIVYRERPLAEWARECGINYYTLLDRWEAGERGDELFRAPKPHMRGKDHCPRGHLLDEENTMIRSGGARACRICDRARQRARYAQRQQQGERR